LVEARERILEVLGFAVLVDAAGVANFERW